MIERIKLEYDFQNEQNAKLVTYTDWCAGDGLLWDSSIEHLDANADFEKKYTPCRYQDFY
jgi:hypothetical protein